MSPPITLTPDELLHTMRATLEAEKTALERLDANGLEAATEEKDRILARLRAASPWQRGELFKALAELQPELERNLVMLTQARALIGDVRQKASNASGFRPKKTSLLPRRDTEVPPTRKLGAPW